MLKKDKTRKFEQQSHMVRPIKVASGVTFNGSCICMYAAPVRSRLISFTPFQAIVIKVSDAQVQTALAFALHCIDVCTLFPLGCVTGSIIPYLSLMSSQKKEKSSKFLL